MSDEFNKAFDNSNDFLSGENSETAPPMSEVQGLDAEAVKQIEEAEKIITVNDEIAEFNKTVLGQLESPLIVHKKSDASYDEKVSVPEMYETHSDEKKPTLMRHRFKKEKKSKSSLVVPLVIIVILASVFAGLYVSGNITFDTKQDVTKQKETTTEATTSIEEKYQGTIVVKNMYIFVDGTEVNGIEGLQDELKYLDKSETAFSIIDENANVNFLNYEILPLLEQMGFYGEQTEITHIQSTGLIAQEETTTLLASTTAAKE